MREVDGLKRCPRCGLEKPVSEYHKNPRASDGLCLYCRTCKSIISKDRYAADPRPASVINRKRRELTQAYLDSLKASGCVDCGSKNLTVLEFDHVRGKKLIDVGKMGGYSWARIDAEIAKCEVRCANCHRIVTRSRRRGGVLEMAA